LNAYAVRFQLFQNQDYGSSYTGLNLIPEPLISRKESRMPTTNRP